MKAAMSALLVLFLGVAVGADSLPAASERPALDEPHFPDRVHAFVWKNWELVGIDRMAEVLGTTPEKILETGRAMGLPDPPAQSSLQPARSYISVIRRNWHLLPYEQLLKLLDWPAEKLAYTLREDDFLWHKLGALKPMCAPLTYREPTEAVRARCEQMRTLVQAEFGEELRRPGAARFAFVEELSATPDAPASSRGSDGGIRFLYSYFAVYGDPLLDPQADPYPEGLLARLASSGVTGVWMHTALRELAPSTEFPEFGAGHEKRLATLRSLVTRARRHGISVYLYMNEPRAMTGPFFTGREAMRGVQEGDHYAMCTSSPQVRTWIADALTHVFRSVPDLGGVFTITASENFTNCASHFQSRACPQCGKRDPAEIITEVNRTIEEGVHRGNPDAKVIVWDWGWPDEWAMPVINALPKSCHFMSVSEWSMPITRGGVSSSVGEYSISAVGPGPRATRHWAIAKAAGLKTIAKVQVNNTWELSAVPWIPAMNLVARHMEGLSRSGVDGLMLSWTLGGYPSLNLQLASTLLRPGAPPAEQVLDWLARERYGDDAAPHIVRAWKQFSDAFEEFPYHGGFLYNGPMQCGPANLLRNQPTGYPSTMVGFPYDDLKGWRAIYPPEVLGGQLAKVSDGWEAGLESFREGVKSVDSSHRRDAERDLGIADAAAAHFRSAANQVRFYIARSARDAAPAGSPARAEAVRTMQSLATSEIALARRMFALTRADSRIGYEASNHYYYVPTDFIEKVVSCRYVLDTASAASAPAR